MPEAGNNFVLDDQDGDDFVLADQDGDDFVLALEVGGTHVAGAMVNISTWRLRSEIQRLPLDAAGSAAEFIQGLARCAERILLSSGVGTGLTLRCGIAMPGPFEYTTGIAQFSGVAKFESLFGVDVGYELRNAISPEPKLIRFGNDADAFAVGEWLVGATRGATRCAAITLGTGVGSCFLTDGVPVSSGPEVPPEGEAHLIRLDGRPLEELVSRRAIRTAYFDTTRQRQDVREIAELARTGDVAAQRVLGEYGRILGHALGPYLTRFQAQRLVLGGSIAASWDLFEVAFRTELHDRDLPIFISQNPERSALIGAASFAAGLPDPHEDSRVPRRR